MRISELFEDEPVQWGLRGDPCLWEDLKGRLGSLPLPETPDDLQRLLYSAIKELTGNTLEGITPIRVERYDRGGMSSGMLSPEFWRETAIPLLVSRHESMRGGES